MKDIPSTTICNTYYAFFVIYAVLFGLGLLSSAYMYFGLKGLNPALKVGLFLLNGLFSAVVVVLMMFMYIMCDRAIVAPEVAAAAAAATQKRPNF